MATARFDPDTFGIVLFATLRGRSEITLRMVLDTGATLTTMPLEAALALGYEPSRSGERAEIITADRVIDAPIVSVPSISVLGEVCHNVPVAVHDLPEASRVDGLLGLSFLRNFRVVIDFKDGLLKIE